MNIGDFFCADTSRPKFVNTLRPKCIDSSYKQYV